MTYNTLKYDLNFEKVLTVQNYKDACVNRGFLVVDTYTITYTQQKKGMSYYYDKKIVCANGIDTLPLPIENKKSFGRSFLLF